MAQRIKIEPDQGSRVTIEDLLDGGIWLLNESDFDGETEAKFKKKLTDGSDARSMGLEFTEFNGKMLVGPGIVKDKDKPKVESVNDEPGQPGSQKKAAKKK